MRIPLLLAALLAASSLSCATAAPSGRVYRVTWGSTDLSSEGLATQLDQQLREALQRRGATLIDDADPRAAIILRPHLSVTAHGLELNLAGVRSTDQQLIGSASMKATGSSRNAQVAAIVKRACLEADRFQ